MSPCRGKYNPQYFNEGGKKTTTEQFSMNDAKNKHLLQVCKPVMVQSPTETAVNWIEGKGNKEERVSTRFCQPGFQKIVDEIGRPLTVNCAFKPSICIILLSCTPAKQKVTHFISLDWFRQPLQRAGVDQMWVSVFACYRQPQRKSLIAPELSGASEELWLVKSGQP